MYVDFEYYSSVFSGSVLSEGAFQKAEQEAETYIRYLTYLNGDIFADTAQADAIKGAVCAAADAYHMAVRETAEGVLVKHFCNTLFEKFTTCSVLQMVSSSCCTNAV